MIYRYPENVKSFIAQNVKGTTTRDLVRLVNAKFGPLFTETKMKSYKQNHKLRSETPCGLPAGRPTELHPLNVRAFIEDNHTGIGPKDMAKLVNEKIGTCYTHDQIKSYYRRHDINSGLNGQFPKGHAPANKGTHIGGWEPTQFKKGHIPANYKPVGTEQIKGDGYVWVKIADPNKWRQKHIFVWEKEKGEVPENHVLLFLDGNKQNPDIKNLKLISRRQLAALNRNHLLQKDKNLNVTALLTADLIIKIVDNKQKVRREA